MLARSLLLWESNKYYTFWVCDSSLISLSRNAYGPFYIIICDLSGSTRFFHISHKRHSFQETVIESSKCVPNSLHIFWNIFHFKENSERYYHTCTYVIVRRGGRIGSWWGNRREGDQWGDLGVDGWRILGWVSRRWDVGMWTGLSWPRIGTGGGRLWVR